MSEKKYDYIIKTLSRTKRKDYENYIINRIYNKLDDLDIKPMSQKYVKRPKGEASFALIDLYFPQFNFGIEINEKYHDTSEREILDELRTEDIINYLDGYEHKKISISENSSLDSLHKEIDEIVCRLKELKEEKEKKNEFSPWSEKSAEEFFKDESEISKKQEFEFATITEASNTVFKTTYIGQQHAYFEIKLEDDKNTLMAWFPQLAIEINGKSNPPKGKDWINTISDDGKTIVEEFNGETEDYFKKNKSIDKYDRITFMKMKNKITNKSAYKFLGVYKFVKEEDSGKKRTYELKEDKFNIIKDK